VMAEQTPTEPLPKCFFQKACSNLVKKTFRAPGSSTKGILE
jgi:hypothetical protein